MSAPPGRPADGIGMRVVGCDREGGEAEEESSQDVMYYWEADLRLTPTLVLSTPALVVLRAHGER